MRHIQIYDTTLRDGTQGEGVSLSLQDKLQITQRLDSIGVDYVEGGYPLSNEKDVEFFAECVRSSTATRQSMCFRHDATPWDHGCGRSRHAGLGRIGGTGHARWSARPGIFTSREVLRVSLEENLEMIADSVRFLWRRGTGSDLRCRAFL